jgi:hypothetical protein
VDNEGKPVYSNNTAYLEKELSALKKRWSKKKQIFWKELRSKLKNGMSFKNPTFNISKWYSPTNEDINLNTLESDDLKEYLRYIQAEKCKYLICLVGPDNGTPRKVTNQFGCFFEIEIGDKSHTVMDLIEIQRPGYKYREATPVETVWLDASENFSIMHEQMELSKDYDFLVHLVRNPFHVMTNVMRIDKDAIRKMRRCYDKSQNN